tara:strand:+ start:2123 stop:2413 length:291 start_codon:yes stop_codon:yes gene_type:complete
MGETTEQTLIDMANDMKNIVEEKDVDMKKYKEKYMDLKKDIGKMYGLIRIIQENFGDMAEIGVDEIVSAWCITEIRSMCSDVLFEEEEKQMDIYGY